MSQPFEHLIIDCVVPLPQSKSGCSVFVNCDVSVHQISGCLSPAYCHCKICNQGPQPVHFCVWDPQNYTDQRSNFTSRLFAQVLQHPQVKHNMASAYHPHGQGALERFHQHLKSLLCAYWTELKADWEDGLPWLLLAIEKLSKKIWDLVPMNLLLRTLSVVHDQWMLPDRPQNFITYVNDFSGCVLFFSRTYRLTFDSTDELAADFI